MGNELKSKRRGNGGEFKKGEVTRERIILAALKVFSEHPYKAASIRMIGKAGGFDHPLIHYYFPTKAELFEAVVEQMCESFVEANDSWFEGLERISPREGFPLYVERFLGYHFKRPESLRIMMLNLAQVDKLEEIPGYQHIPETLSKTRRTFEQKIPLRAGSKEIDMFINSFNTLVITYLGASSCMAQTLGMDPGGDEYRGWVKETLIYIFLPLLEKLIFPDRG